MEMHLSGVALTVHPRAIVPRKGSQKHQLLLCAPVLLSLFPSFPKKGLHMGPPHSTTTPHRAFCSTNTVKTPALKPCVVLCPQNPRVQCCSTWLSPVFTCKADGYTQEFCSAPGWGHSTALPQPRSHLCDCCCPCSTPFGPNY